MHLNSIKIGEARKWRAEMHLIAGKVGSGHTF